MFFFSQKLTKCRYLSTCRKAWTAEVLFKIPDICTEKRFPKCYATFLFHLFRFLPRKKTSGGNARFSDHVDIWHTYVRTCRRHTYSSREAFNIHTLVWRRAIAIVSRFDFMCSIPPENVSYNKAMRSSMTRMEYKKWLLDINDTARELIIFSYFLTRNSKK